MYIRIKKAKNKIIRLYGTDINYSWRINELKIWNQMFSIELLLFFIILNVDTYPIYRYIGHKLANKKQEI